MWVRIPPPILDCRSNRSYEILERNLRNASLRKQTTFVLLTFMVAELSNKFVGRRFMAGIDVPTTIKMVLYAIWQSGEAQNFVIIRVRLPSTPLIWHCTQTLGKATSFRNWCLWVRLPSVLLMVLYANWQSGWSQKPPMLWVRLPPILLYVAVV